MKLNFFNAVIAGLALSVSAAAVAAPLQLRSDIFVEKQVKRQDGKVATVLEAPKMVTPGDNLVFVVHYKNVGATPASNFVVTNPMPKAVIFNGTSDGTEIVSIDGGKSFAPLSTLRVAIADGKTRSATFGDVTHVKWALQKTLGAGAEGKLMFRGVVK